MDLETVLRGTIAMLGSCHVLGSESETFSSALKNLKAIVEAIEKAKEEAKNDSDA